MASPILHLGATVTCKHAGMAQPTAPFARVLVSGQPVTTLTAPYTIAGCGRGNSPCGVANWVLGAARVRAGGVPILTTSSSAVCVPTGTGLSAIASQTRVLAT